MTIIKENASIGPISIQHPPKKYSTRTFIIITSVIITLVVILNCIPFKQEGIYGSISLNASDSEKLSYQNISNNLNLNYKIENRTKPPGVYLTPYNNTNILVSV